MAPLSKAHGILCTIFTTSSESILIPKLKSKKQTIKTTQLTKQKNKDEKGIT